MSRTTDNSNSVALVDGATSGPAPTLAELEQARDDASLAWAEHAIDCEPICVRAADRSPCDEGRTLFAVVMERLSAIDAWRAQAVTV